MVHKQFDVDEAQQLAIEALAFLADQPDLLARFLELTGIEAVDIRQVACQEGFWAGILSFLCANETDLWAFCHHANKLPEQVTAALRCLPGGIQEEM